MLTSLAPARRRLVLALAAVLLVAVLFGVLVAATSARHGSAKAPAVVSQDVAGPVLLVPGYGGSTTGLTVLAGRLRAGGKDVEVLNLPDSGQGDLAAQAKLLAATAQAAIRRSGAPSVDVVGFSAGGVVARLWLEQYGGTALARRVVTLGSPQHGTALAALGALFAGQCPTACQQLNPTSSLLSTLNSSSTGTGPEVPAGTAFVSIWSSHDEVVIPTQSAVLRGALNIEVQSVCPASTVNHSGLPTDPVVAAMVAAELTRSAPVPLTAADCGRLSR
jgi:triacylglycerol lipase